MGEPIKAEKVVKHFATVTSPGMSAVPFGKRAVPTLPAVDFSNAVDERVRRHPWTSTLIAFGVGVVVGFVLHPSREAPPRRFFGR